MKISQTVFMLQSGHKYIMETTIYNVPRATSPKEGKQVLWFLCSAQCLIVLHICSKFHENISKCLQVTEQA